MSREVDSRVVEMQFNNENFEKNTKQTIGTIDKLMEKLQFKGAEKGFEKLDAAAEDVDFSTMQRSLDTLESKFSTLNIVATTALMNITNKFVDAGEKMVKSLSFDQVMSGWNKYVEKTGNIQTIMNATGDSIDTVNGYLNKLMWYSDETSFSFNEMTSALSQMTASGGDIKKMIPMIMGIANATADAGKSGFAFQSTIRNLTQSYSAGHLQLQDWKSLNLMGTATKALKQELIDTAVELGTLKKGEVTIGSFESSLSKKWANTKVMEKTFEKYASMMEAAYEMTQKNPGMTSSEALEKLSGQYGELAERSALAAQQAKSFSEAIDSTKDAVSSKWMRSFELIFGNKEEATDTWTELANRLYDIFVPPIDALNERLSKGLDSGWQQLNSKLGDQAEVYDTVLQKVALASGAVTEESIEEAGSFAKALEEGGVNAELLQNGLDSTLVTLRNYLGLSDKELNARNLDKDAIQKDYDALTKLNEEVQKGTVNLIDYAKGMSQVSGRQHLMQSLWNIMDAIGKVVQPITEAFHELFPPADGDRIYSFAERLDLMTQKLIISDETAAKIKKTFKGVFSVLKVFTTVLSKVGAAAKEAFGLALNALKPVGEVLLNVSAGFGEFLETVMQTVTGSGTLKEKLGGIKTALGKLLSPLSDLGGMMKSTKIAQYIGQFIEQGENATGVLGNLYSVGKRVFGMLSVLVQGVASGGVGILSGLGMAAGTLLGKLGSLGQTISDFIGLSMPTMEEFQQSLTDMPKNLAASMSEFASGFKSSMDKINGSVGDAFAPVKQFFTALKEGFDSITGTDVYRFMSLIDVGLLAVAINQVAKAMNSLKKMLQTPLTGMLDSISGTFKQLTSAIKTWQKNNASKTLVSMASAVLILAGAMYVMSRIDPDRFYTVSVVTMTSIVLLASAAKLLEPTAKKFNKAFDSLKSNVLNAAILWGTAAALIGLGVAVGSITKGLSNLVAALNEGDIAANAAALAIAATAVVALMLAMGELSKALMIGEKVINHKVLLSTAAEMIALGAAIKIVSTALEPLSQIKFTSLAKAGLAVVSLGGLLTSMATVVAAVQKLIGPTGFQNGAAIAAMASGIWIAARAVSSIANIKLVNLDAAMTSIKTLMLLMTTMSALSAKTKFTSGAAIFMMSSSLIVLAGAVELFAVMGDGAIDGLIKVAAGLTALTIASSMSTGGASSGAGILLTASALYVLAAAVEKFAALGIGELLRGGISALLGLGGLIGGLVVFTKFGIASALDGLGSAMIKMSAALLIMAPAIKLLGDADPESVGQALQVFLDGMLIAMLGGALLAAMPQLAVGLELLATAFWNFAKSLGVIALATAAMGVLSMFAGPICTAIINAAPDIQEALTTVVTMLCEVIKNCAGPIVEAFGALVRAVIPECWQLAKDGLSFLGVPETWGELFSGIGNAMKDAALGIFDWFGEIFEDDRPVGMAVNGIKSLGGKIVEAFQSFFGIASPSKVMAENGRYVLAGLQEGLQDEGALAKVKNAMHSVATAIRNVFTTFWGIHSPSDLAATDAENILEGAILGMADENARERLRQESYNAASEVNKGVGQALDEATATVQTKMQGLYQAFKASNPLKGNATYQNGIKDAAKELTDAQNNNVLIPGKNGITKAGNSGKTPSTLEQIQETVKNGVATLTQPVQSYIDETIDSLYQKTSDTVADATGSTSKGHSGTSKSTKTAADKLADEYSKKLKANKAKMDAADKEYKLWEATSGDTATAEELLAKKTESLTTEIANQTDRVAIAKEQYDKIVAEASSTDTQKSDAYATLLDEQTTLADLQHEKQETLFKAIKDRYDNEADTATDEYELWSALYEDTASVEEKSNKKIANINRKLAAQAKVVTAAEDEYTALKAEFGEKSAKTQEAYRQWLEEQTVQQNLINEMNRAQLDAFDDALAVLEKHEKLVTNRQNMLAKIYGDGDLSQREKAYKAAVEKYGENSKEARKAATQGTMTAIIGVGTALDSMSYSLKKVTNRQTKYTEAIAKFGKDSDEALDAYADLQSEQYNFVGFAENLADAFEMDDSGKRMMMQLGYAISRNWKPIQNGFKTVMAKVQRSFPQLADKMAKAFGVATGEGFTNVVTDIFGVITAAVSGDWGQALTSGITAILDFAGSDFGQKIIANLAPLLMGLPKVFGELAAGGKTLTIMGKAVTVAGKGVGSLGLSLGGLIGEGGVLSKIISTVVQFAANLGPEGWIIAAIVAGVAVCAGLIIKNWDKVVEFFQNFGKWVSNLFSNIWNGIKKGFEGIGNFLSKAWEGTKKFVSGAIDTGKNFVKGLGEGIKNAATGVVNGVKTVCSNVANAVKNFWGIHSPSTLMAEMGGYICAGFAKGITDSSDGVNRSMEDVMSGAEGVALMAANSLLGALSTDDADEPLIRPVVDLSDVQNGADWINTNLGEDQSFALSAERSAGLAGSVARKAAQNRSAALEADTPDPNVMSNRDIVESVQALGEHVDGIAEAVRNMKLSLNGRQLVGGIIDEVDVQMGKRVRR